MPIDKPVEKKIVVSGVNSEKRIEVDLGIIQTVMEWFIEDAPKEKRNLHTVGRLIRFNDDLIELIAAEDKSNIAYIEKRAIEENKLPDSIFPSRINPFMTMDLISPGGE